MLPAPTQIRLTRALTEHESKQFLAGYGIPVTREALAASANEAARAARELGFPVALKASGQAFAHKSDLGLVELDLRDAAEVDAAFARLEAKAPGLEQVLVQEMVRGGREFVAGLIRDPQYGPAVMFGLGGIYTEALRDVAFRVAPLTTHDALDMLDELRGRRLLQALRGEPAADSAALARLLITLGRIGLDAPSVAEIDLNPVKLRDGRPVAVDALVVVYD